MIIWILAMTMMQQPAKCLGNDRGACVVDCPNGKEPACPEGRMCECAVYPTSAKVEIVKPIKCGKYQHVVEGKEASWQTCSDVDPSLPKGACRQQTVHFQTDHCAPDLHVLTEKEWQELMQRLKRLEYKGFTVDQQEK